jgi:Fe-S cluster assembly iron-binding protein IscA
VERYDPAKQRLSMSEGFKIVVAKDQKEKLDGLVIDFVNVGATRGFTFDHRSTPVE